MFVPRQKVTQRRRAVAPSAIGRNKATRPALTDNRSVPLQAKRKRSNEIPEDISPVQRAVNNDVPDNTRIIIDNPGAPDFGDTGTIIRRSTVEKNCMAVEFDNEKGVLYRVYNHEMSPLASDEPDAYTGRTARFSITARNNDINVVIVGTFDLTDPGNWSADFTAIQGDTQVGDLNVVSYKDRGFYLTNINTAKVPPDQRVAGLGAILLHVAAVMAMKFGFREIDLSATRKKDAHPGPFYKKFGFRTDFSLQEWSGNLAEYLSTHGNKTINMKGDAQTVADQTGQYATGKNWQFSQWRAQQ